jgi:hypothetical protein
MLRLLGFRRWQSIMVQLAPLGEASVQIQRETLFQHARKTARVVRVAAWYGPYGGKCLEQSLVLWFLLRRQRIKSELRIGVRKEAKRFEAHAWVELLGLPLDESESVHQRFKPFDHAIIPLEARSS